LTNTVALASAIGVFGAAVAANSRVAVKYWQQQLLMMRREAAVMGRMFMAEEVVFTTRTDEATEAAALEMKSSDLQGFKFNFTGPRIGPTPAHPRECKLGSEVFLYS
jgi:hypothetical protein